MNIPIIGKIIDKVFGVVDEIIPDADKKLEIKQKLIEKIESDGDFRNFILQYEGSFQMLPKSMKILRAAFRPVMSWWVFFLFNYMLFFPEKAIKFVSALQQIPMQMWALFMIIIGFWFGQRSVEYVIKAWKENK